MTLRLTNRVAIGGLISLTVVRLLAAPQYSDWAAPTNVGPLINSAFIEGGPAVSKDGLSLYFASGRPGGFGNQDIWVSRRFGQDDPWGPPVNVGGTVNGPTMDGAPALSRDEHWLFFNSNRPGGFGGNDIWASYRASTKDDFGWQPAVNLGVASNTPFQNAGATYFQSDEDGRAFLMFQSDRPGGFGATDIYQSEILPDGSFAAPILVSELNSTDFDFRPSVRFDGLEIIFSSNRTGSLGGVDMWAATRRSVFEAWSTPINLGPNVNSSDDDQQPYIAGDRQTLYFVSNRPGGLGQLDVYVSRRLRLHP